MLESYRNGTWEDLEPHVFKGSSWHIAEDMYVYASGSWEIVWQNIASVSIAADATDVVLTDLIHGAAPKRIHIVIAHGVTVSASSVSKAALTISGITGKEIVIDNFGTIAGHFGRGTTGVGEDGGPAVHARSPVVINNHGKIAGGGGGGGKGGKGGIGDYTTTSQRTVDTRDPAQGDKYDRNHSWDVTQGTVADTVEVTWGGHAVAHGTNGGATLLRAGGITYYRGLSKDTGFGISRDRSFGVFRITGTHQVTDTHHHDSEGGEGGKGGDGQGAEWHSKIGIVGHGATQGAGRGGTGGHGGEFGHDGHTGETGANGSKGSGIAGQAGGKAGKAIDGISHVTYHEFGTTLGEKVN